MLNTLKDPHLQDENYQNFHMVHKHVPNYLESHVKLILQFS
jgi:hypothetical protein